MRGVDVGSMYTGRSSCICDGYVCVTMMAASH